MGSKTEDFTPATSLMTAHFKVGSATPLTLAYAKPTLEKRRFLDKKKKKKREERGAASLIKKLLSPPMAQAQITVIIGRDG
jgi:hypothetical protein